MRELALSTLTTRLMWLLPLEASSSLALVKIWVSREEIIIVLTTWHVVLEKSPSANDLSGTDGLLSFSLGCLQKLIKNS